MPTTLAKAKAELAKAIRVSNLKAAAAAKPAPGKAPNAKDVGKAPNFALKLGCCACARN